MMLPRSDSDSYRQQLIASLEARSERFRRVGDESRLAATRIWLTFCVNMHKRLSIHLRWSSR